MYTYSNLYQLSHKMYTKKKGLASLVNSVMLAIKLSLLAFKAKRLLFSFNIVQKKTSYLS